MAVRPKNWVYPSPVEVILHPREGPVFWLPPLLSFLQCSPYPREAWAGQHPIGPCTL